MSSYICATCGREATYEGPLPSLYPFCSERCKWIDLGKWLRGEYSIDRDLTPGEPRDAPSPPDARDG